MSVPIETTRRYTVSEYLQFEQGATEKHEYRAGEIIAMAGGSPNHAIVIANVTGELRAALRGKPCRAISGDLRVRAARNPLFTYPDATVVCGELELDPRDPSGHTLLNPRVLVEVLSPSTEGYDRGEKFSRYREIDALQDYVLIRQDVAEVNVFHRREDGTWLFTAAAGLEARIPLQSIGVELLLSELYAGVEFPPRPEPVQER